MKLNLSDLSRVFGVVEIAEKVGGAVGLVEVDGGGLVLGLGLGLGCV